MPSHRSVSSVRRPAAEGAESGRSPTADRRGSPEPGRMKQTTRQPFLPPRWFIRVAWAVHRAIYRMSGGRRGLRPPTPETYGTLRIHTIGRRSGVERIAILGYFE